MGERCRQRAHDGTAANQAHVGPLRLSLAAVVGLLDAKLLLAKPRGALENSLLSANVQKCIGMHVGIYKIRGAFRSAVPGHD